MRLLLLSLLSTISSSFFWSSWYGGSPSKEVSLDLLLSYIRSEEEVPLLGGGTRRVACSSALRLARNRTDATRVVTRTQRPLPSSMSVLEGRQTWTFSAPVLVSVSSGSLRVVKDTKDTGDGDEQGEERSCRGMAILLDSPPYSVVWDRKEPRGGDRADDVGVGLLYPDGEYRFGILSRTIPNPIQRRRLESERCPLLLSGLASNVCLGRNTETCLTLTEKYVGNGCCEE